MIRDWGAISRYVEESRVFRPDPSRADRATARYRLWRKTYKRLKTLYPRIGSDAKNLIANAPSYVL